MEELESGEELFITQNTFIQENIEIDSFDFFHDLFVCLAVSYKYLHKYEFPIKV